MAQQILRPLGQTALTLLYLARGSAAGDGGGLFSLELLHPELAQDESLRASFLEEAALATQLGHPNLIGTRAVLSGLNGYGRTTEWCDGQPLSRVLERVGRTGFPLRLQVWIHCQILAALEHGHHFFEHLAGPGGLIHGAVSPDSVLLGYDGQVRLMGMGFSRSRALLERRLGQLLIESCYAAPERYVGSAPTPSEDLYGVGAMLWEAATQMQRGLASSLVDVFRPRASDETPSVAELCPEAPQSLARICERVLGQTPLERYPDALGMRAELEAFLAETRSAAEQEPGPALLAELLDRHFAPERLDLAALGEPLPAERAVGVPAAPADAAPELGLLRFTAEVGDDRTHTVTSFDEPILTGPEPIAEAPNAATPNAATPNAAKGGGVSALESHALRPLDAELADAELVDARPADTRPGGPESARVWPGASPRQLALTQALDPEVIIAAWRARRELKRRRLAGVSPRTPISREAWRVGGTVLGVAAILILFAIARYGVPGARGIRSAPSLSGAAAAPSPRSEPGTPSVRSALLPAAPVATPNASSRRLTEPIASSLTAPGLDAHTDAPVAPVVPARPASKTGRTSAPVEDPADHFHPRYLRAEDVAQLREIDDAKIARDQKPGSAGKHQPNWKTRFEKILRSATPAGSTAHEPRRIDEEDPYSP